MEMARSSADIWSKSVNLPRSVEPRCWGRECPSINFTGIVCLSLIWATDVGRLSHIGDGVSVRYETLRSSLVCLFSRSSSFQRTRKVQRKQPKPKKKCWGSNVFMEKKEAFEKDRRGIARFPVCPRKTLGPSKTPPVLRKPGETHFNKIQDFVCFVTFYEVLLCNALRVPL